VNCKKSYKEVRATRQRAGEYEFEESTSQRVDLYGVLRRHRDEPERIYPRRLLG
jgi:hypothetical protein